MRLVRSPIVHCRLPIRRAQALSRALAGGGVIPRMAAAVLALLIIMPVTQALAESALTWRRAAEMPVEIEWVRPGPVVVTAADVQLTPYDVPWIDDQWKPRGVDDPEGDDAADWWDSGLPITFLADDDDRQPEPANLGAELRMGWNAQGLALLVRVTDDVAVEQGDTEQLWDGDALELFVSTGVGSENYFQVAVSPGRDPEHPEPRHKFYDKPGGVSADELAIHKSVRIPYTDDGYIVELLLPWSNLGSGDFNPRSGATFGFQIYVNDHDDPQDKDDWRWIGLHPARNAADNPDTMRAFRLADRRSHGIHARARIQSGEDEAEHRQVVVRGPGDLAGQSVRIESDQGLLGEAVFEAEDRIASATVNIPAVAEGRNDQPLQATFVLSGKLASLENGRINVEKPNGHVTSLRISQVLDEQVHLHSVSGEPATLALADLNDSERDYAHVSAMTHLVEWDDARALTVHEELGLLVVGYGDDNNASLAVFELDDKGRVDEKPKQRLTLPKAEELGELTSYPLAMSFHPDLEVLYVWQDVTGGDAETVREHFDHLVIYTIEDGELKEEGAYGRGDEYAHGQSEASLAVSGDGNRLFIPNLRFGSGDGAVGYFDLDEQGMIVPVPVPVEGSLDGRGINEFDMQIKPHWADTGRNRAASRYYRHIRTLPTGTGFFAPDKRALVFGSISGFGVWDTQDRRGELSEVTVAGIGSSSSGTYVGGHNELPMIYAVRRGGSEMMSMAHARGFPTLMPEKATASGAEFRSPPVVFSGQSHGLAVGGANRFYLVGLDDSGNFNDRVYRFDAPGSNNVRALTYSPAYDRLYVAVNRIPR